MRLGGSVGITLGSCVRDQGSILGTYFAMFTNLFDLVIVIGIEIINKCIFEFINATDDYYFTVVFSEFE